MCHKNLKQHFDRLMLLANDYHLFVNRRVFRGRNLSLSPCFSPVHFSRPGTYESDVKQNRQVQMLHSFGGRTKLIPAVKTKCMPINRDQVCMPVQTFFYMHTLSAVCHLFETTDWRLLSISK